MRGVKKPGAPKVAMLAALIWLMKLRTGLIPAIGEKKGPELACSQKVRIRSTRLSGGLPAIRAALIAPMEMPVTHCGSTSAACSASNTPAW